MMMMMMMMMWASVESMQPYSAFPKLCLDSILLPYCFLQIILHFESSFFSAGDLGTAADELSEVGGLQSTSGLMPRTGPVHTNRA